MTIPSFLGLQSALSALQADQEALDVTSQNIASASTPGYSRESAALTPNLPLDIPTASSYGGTGSQLGTGVQVSGINRIRSTFLDTQYRLQSSAAGYSSTWATTLGQVQSILGEPSGNGISGLLSKFWSAWSDLANAPSSAAAQQEVIDAGGALSQGLNGLDAQLGAIAGQVSGQYGTLMGSGGQVQTLAGQIAQLNGQIAQATAAGQTPNALLDQRDTLLDQLSSLGSVATVPQPDGTVQVTFGNAAAPLVSGSRVTWPPPALGANPGGQVGALAALGTKIAGYQSQLDGVAQQLVSSVNGLSGNPPFFSGNSASTIAVAVSAGQIQTSSTGAPGGNDIALKVAGLSGGAADGAYSAFVTGIGGDVQTAESSDTLQQAVLQATSNQRQSVSGVSLDEEMTNLITYQHAYQAASRAMTTMDSMLDTLINHTGTVGL